MFGAPRFAAVSCALLCAVDRERCAHFDHCVANTADDRVGAAFVAGSIHKRYMSGRSENANWMALLGLAAFETFIVRLIYYGL